MNDSKRQTMPLNRTHVATAFMLGVLFPLILGSLGISLLNPLTNWLHEPAMRPPLAFEGKCTRIGDGQTIYVTSKRREYKVNLVSIDAPNAGEKQYAQSLQYTAQLLVGKEVTVQPSRGVVSGEVDAWVYSGPLCINSEIVKAGYARWSSANFRDAPVKAFEDEAKRAKRGIWNELSS